MSRKKRTPRGGTRGTRGNPRGSSQQRIFWVLSLLVALSMVAYFGPTIPQRRNRPPPPPPVVTVTPIPTPQPTPTP